MVTTATNRSLLKRNYGICWLKSHWSQMETAQMAISKRIGKPIARFHTVEYYLAVKRSNCCYSQQHGSISQTLCWVKKKPDTKKIHTCMIPFIWWPRTGQANPWMIENRKRMSPGVMAGDVMGERINSKGAPENLLMWRNVIYLIWG